ncbi:MAG: BamA/TamA family outer membrane protein [Bacteroidota bacterium]
MLSILKHKNIILIVAGWALFSACNISRIHKREGPKLVKNKVEIEEKGKGRFFESDLESQIKQKPGSKFLGIVRLNVFFYRLGDAGKKDTKLKRFFRDELGSVPVILDSSMIETSVRAMRNYLKSQGYYYSEITYTVADRTFLKERKVVTYHVKLNNQYKYNKLNVNCPDKKLYELINATISESNIKIGRSFNREDFLNEQNRITTNLRNNGYYTFAKEYIDFNIDTNYAEDYLAVDININNKTEQVPFNQYYIRNLVIEVEPNHKNKTKKYDTLVTKNFKYLANGSKINPTILDKMNFLMSGEIFQQNNLNKTYTRLNDLQLFRLVTITPTLVENDTQHFIDFYISLKQLGKYDFTIEPQAITSDQGNLVATQSSRNFGLAAVIQLTDRNIFHNGEILQFRFRTSFEAQRGENISPTPFFNSNEQSLTASIIIPQLLFLPKLDRKFNNASTKTIINSSIIYEKNVDYQRRVLTLGSSYQLNRKLTTYYVAFPEISYIQTSFNNASLEERSKTDIFLQNVFANNLIINDIRLGLTYSTQPISKGKSFFFLRFDALELAGNIVTGLNILLDAPKVTDESRNIKDKYEILGLNYFQYVKSYIDGRYNQWIDLNNTMVYRLAVGYALPYGNSPDYIPFEKRFFTGGANSLRAFRPRSVGPGVYSTTNQIDKSGDIKIEMNAEYRFNLYKRFIEGALFTDAGNVWVVRQDGRVGADFDITNFYNQLAVGSGVGVRLNLSIFVFRLDAAVPLHDPTQTIGNRWVIENAKDLSWYWDNSIFNFGIGYPF